MVVACGMGCNVLMRAVQGLQLRSMRRDLSTENSNVEVLINSLHELALDTTEGYKSISRGIR